MVVVRLSSFHRFVVFVPPFFLCARKIKEKEQPMHPGQNKVITEPMTTEQCLSCLVAVTSRSYQQNKPTQTVVVSTGLRWWPCCCPDAPSSARGVRTSSRFRFRSLTSRISACGGHGWPYTFSIICWLIMTGLHPHPGPGSLAHAANKYAGSRDGMAFKLGPEGLGYYVDRGGCTIEIAPLLEASASLPPSRSDCSPC